MSIERPPLLKDDAELGAVIRAGDQASLSAERLARSREAVKALATAAPASIAWLWKIGVLLVAVLALVLIVQLPGGDAREEPPPAPAALPPQPAVAVAPVDAGVEVTEPPPPAIDPAPAPTPAPRPRRKPVKTAEPAPDAGVEAPSSDLPEQIRLYEEARDAGRRGDFTVGIATIDELLRRFPATPLRDEAELTRAELYTRADRIDDAVRALEDLIDDPSHAGRRGELLRTLGDVHRKAGDCARATDAYTRAQAERLGKRERAKVERGLARCAS
jgi:tetratricopeptide (TPR) repeat protein